MSLDPTKVKREAGARSQESCPIGLITQQGQEVLQLLVSMLYSQIELKTARGETPGPCLADQHLSTMVLPAPEIQLCYLN